MSVFRGAYFARGFILKTAAGVVIPITDWTFESDIRVKLDDAVPLLTLNTANGGFAITDGPSGRFEFRLTAEQTAVLPAGRFIFDVLRTDAVPGPVWLFGGKFTVRNPVTRDDP